MRFIAAAIFSLLLASCASLPPEQWPAHFGRKPSPSEFNSLVDDYSAQENLVLMIPKDSQVVPAPGRITPAFMLPIARRAHSLDGNVWPSEKSEPTGLSELIVTSGPPPANAAAVGYLCRTTHLYKNAAGEQVGQIDFSIFVSEGKIKIFTYTQSGDVHLVRRAERTR